MPAIALVMLAGACAGHVVPSPVAAPPRRAGDAAAATARYWVERPGLLPDALTVPLERRGALLFAAARIDDRAVGDFLLDTGANATAVDLTLAEALGLPFIGDAEVGGIHRTTAADVRRLTRLTTGGLRLRSTTTVALPLDGHELLGSVAGIIGFPTVGAVPFAIDFARPSLTVYNPARFQPPAGAASARLRVHASAPYVEATLAGGETIWLLLDTGSATPVTLWRRTVEAFPDVLTVPHKRWVNTIGIGGGTQAMVSEVRSLEVLGRDLRGATTVVYDAPAHMWQHPRAAGILGIAPLRDLRLTIDPTQRRIWSEPAG